MAKLSVTVAVTFTFFLFSFTIFTQARIPSELPQDDVIGRELTRSVLRLPSDSLASHHDESRSNQPAVDISESESISVRSTPLRVSTLRPINRHFPIGSSLRFRNCHHRHHRHQHLGAHPFFMPIRQRQEQQQENDVVIPYGNDMVLSASETNELDPFVFHHGRMRRIPAKWIKFHHHHHHEDDDDDNDGDRFPKFVSKHRHIFGKEKFKKHLRHRREEAEDEEENHEDMKKRVEKRDQEEGSLMKRIRKFLDISSKI